MSCILSTVDISIIPRELYNLLALQSGIDVHYEDKCMINIEFANVMLEGIEFKISDSALMIPILSVKDFFNAARKVSISSKNKKLQDLVDNSKFENIHEARRKHFFPSNVTILGRDLRIMFMWPIYIESIDKTLIVSDFHQKLFGLENKDNYQIIIQQIYGKKERYIFDLRNILFTNRKCLISIENKA